MNTNSPVLKKQNYNRSRSRSRSKDRVVKKSASKAHMESKAKYEEENKRGSSPEDNELERKFKDFEAEIHAIDPSNKSEKNETKQKKTFETTENLILLYNKRIYVEGFPLDELEDKDHNPKIKEEFKDFFKDSKEVAIMTSSKEGKPLLLIEFETRESLDSAIKLLENYDQQGLKLKLHESINSEEKYTKLVLDFSEKIKKKNQEEPINKEEPIYKDPSPTADQTDQESLFKSQNEFIMANNAAMQSLYPQQ